MTTITVKETKNQWQNPLFTLFVDDKQSGFTHHSSRKLTNTCIEHGDGIFNTEKSVVGFQREATLVTVDFGDVWDVALYQDPALAIKHRIKLVEKAFEAVSEGYENVWTVNLDGDNEYIEKRKAEAVQATHYSHDNYQYEVEYFENDLDENGEECFRAVDGYGDSTLISFSQIPQEAYFLKLTRID